MANQPGGGFQFVANTGALQFNFAPKDAPVSFGQNQPVANNNSPFVFKPAQPFDPAAAQQAFAFKPNETNPGSPGGFFAAPSGATTTTPTVPQSFQFGSASQPRNPVPTIKPKSPTKSPHKVAAKSLVTLQQSPSPAVRTTVTVTQPRQAASQQSTEPSLLEGAAAGRKILKARRATQNQAPAPVASPTTDTGRRRVKAKRSAPQTLTYAEFLERQRQAGLLPRDEDDDSEGVGDGDDEASEDNSDEDNDTETDSDYDDHIGGVENYNDHKPASSMWLSFRGKKIKMSKGLQIVGFTPNGKYMLTKDMYFERERWYLWTRKISAITTQQERSEVEADVDIDDEATWTWEYVWRAYAFGEIIGLTNRFLVLYNGDEATPAAIKQFTLLDPKNAEKRDFEDSEDGLVSVYDSTIDHELTICKHETPAGYPYFAGMIETGEYSEDPIIALITGGDGVDFTQVSVFEVKVDGLSELAHSVHDAETYCYSRSSLKVYADSDSSCFYVVDRYAKEIDDTYECVRYRYRFPNTDDVLWEDIDKEDRSDILKDTETVVNFAGTPLKIPFPTKAVTIVSDAGIPATGKAIYFRLNHIYPDFQDSDEEEEEEEGALPADSDGDDDNDEQEQKMEELLTMLKQGPLNVNMDDAADDNK